jgi:LytTr DNA-binding domain-containing protein
LSRTQRRIILRAMASVAPRLSLGQLIFEPLRGPRLLGVGLGVWLAGAAYCHFYQYLMTGMSPGPWSTSLTWSAIAVVPWFALFEWSKQPDGVEATRRPALLAGLVLGIAALSISVEYLVDFCLGDVTDRFGLLVMRRLPAIGVTILLILVARKAVLRRPPTAAVIDLAALAEAIDWVEAADNYIELHSQGKVTLRRMTMRDAERALRVRGFVRIHRRYLVNQSRIAGVLGTNGDRIVQLVGGTELPVGRAFATNLPRIA